MTATELYNQFKAFVDAGDEKGARAFLAEHINEFPEDIRDNIAFAFFEEAVQNDTEGIVENAQIQQEGAHLLEELDKVEAMLEDAKKATEIKDTM
ncbi:MAG TPA: hypothetical protein VG982_01970 [Candidatus Paceibacterota bacterium]|nr:hypothetical protein [Candidatus Paceibacterota bacterium]